MTWKKLGTSLNFVRTLMMMFRIPPKKALIPQTWGNPSNNQNPWWRTCAIRKNLISSDKGVLELVWKIFWCWFIFLQRPGSDNKIIAVFIIFHITVLSSKCSYIIWSSSRLINKINLKVKSGYYCWYWCVSDFTVER